MKTRRIERESPFAVGGATCCFDEGEDNTKARYLKLESKPVCTGGNVKGYILVCLKIDDHNHLIKTEKNLDITFVNISNRETKLLRL